MFKMVYPIFSLVNSAAFFFLCFCFPGKQRNDVTSFVIRHRFTRKPWIIEKYLNEDNVRHVIKTWYTVDIDHKDP